MKQRIAEFLRRVLNVEQAPRVEVPENDALGHYSTNAAWAYSERVGKSPLEAAREIAERVKAEDRGALFQAVEAAPPGFVNFWLSPRAIQEEFVGIRKAGLRWGKPSRRETGKTVVIDYSHPNIAKPMSVAHLRSTIIGDALYRIFKFSGWRTISDNHLGDWGKQFGVLLAAYKSRSLPLNKEITIDDLFALYVDYTARMKTNPALEGEARAETKKLQDGDQEDVKLWKLFYKVSLAEFAKVYKLLGVRFDYYLGESSYKNDLPGIVQDALKKGVARRSEGAVIIPVEGKAPFVIQKSDEAYLYSTTDIAAVKFRVLKFRPQLILYAVDNGQSLHFEQLFSAVKQLGYVTSEKLVHVKFGLILGEDLKKLSTRAGRHIALDEVIAEAIRRAVSVVTAKRPDLPARARERIGKVVGVGVLKYNDLSQNRQSDIAFRWEKMLNLEGNSAPYLMYTHARLRSILRKAGRLGRFEAGAVEQPEELRIIRRLMRFPDVIAEAAQTYLPHLLADYLYGLAKETNAFYQSVPVLKSPPPVRKARIALIAALANTFKTGLNLLGIEAPEEM